MTTLLILGNTNQFTFANSIIAANSKSKDLFCEQLTSIQVVHSFDSYERLRTERDWVNHLNNNGISQELFIERKVEITSERESVDKFVQHLESIVKGNSESTNLIVDLTNGTSFQKNVLSVAAYILDIRYQFVIDTAQLFELTKSKEFLNIDVLGKCYISAPDNLNLDRIAYLNLSEMIRYKRVIESHSKKFVAINKAHADEKFFKDNLVNSIQLKMQGDITKNNATYRIAAASMSSSVEDLISILLDVNPQNNSQNSKLTFGQKLNLIQSKIEKTSSSDFDVEFSKKFNDLLLHIRNSSTHKGKLLTDLEKFKADLSVKLSFPLIEFYTDIVYPMLLNNNQCSNSQKLKRLLDADIINRTKKGEIFYYGLDGDSTGNSLENLFVSSTDENSFKILSESITKAINEIESFIKARAGKKSIVFKAGDDILFKGAFIESDLIKMQGIYERTTSGLTCSIGYGNTFQDVYLALKFAKANQGKNSIIGLELSDD